MDVACESCTYLSLCTRLKSCKSVKLVWSLKEQHFWSKLMQVSSALKKIAYAWEKMAGMCKHSRGFSRHQLFTLIHSFITIYIFSFHLGCNVIIFFVLIRLTLQYKILELKKNCVCVLPSPAIMFLQPAFGGRGNDLLFKSNVLF